MKKAKPLRWIEPAAKFPPNLRQWLVQATDPRSWRGRQATGPVLEVDTTTSLRPLQGEDAERIFFLVAANRSYLQAWLSWIENIKNIQDARRFVRSVNYRDIYAGQWVFGIWHEGKLVGLLDFNEGDRSRREIAIGYWLAAGYQGLGIVTRAAKVCLDYLFAEQQVDRVLIKAATGNEASRGIAERLGFEWDDIKHDAGRVDGKLVDILIYRMEAATWQARKAKS